MKKNLKSHQYFYGRRDSLVIPNYTLKAYFEPQHVVHRIHWILTAYCLVDEAILSWNRIPLLSRESNDDQTFFSDILLETVHLKVKRESHRVRGSSIVVGLQVYLIYGLNT